MTAREALALSGIAAAAVALGATALVAVPFGASADSRTAIGSTVVDLTPGPVKEWAIQLFGTSDKLFLALSVLVVIAVVAARRRALGALANTDGQPGDRARRQSRDRPPCCRGPARPSSTSSPP